MDEAGEMVTAEMKTKYPDSDHDAVRFPDVVKRVYAEDK